MRVVILKDAREVSLRAADLVCELLQNTPACVLGLATGSTPLATYAELIERYRAGKVSFAQARTFNLDEYVGLPAEHPQKYANFMREQLFSQTDFVPRNCKLPDGQATDLLDACAAYEHSIVAAGGIDLQILGLGSDGHIAFNEPGSSLASRTRIKALAEQTRRDNARFFNSLDEVPHLAMTMGVGSIMDSRHIVLLATGENKAEAVSAFIEGPLTAQVPASALQWHPRVTVLLDTAAAARLKRRDYYQNVEQIQRELELRPPKVAELTSHK